jgi:hypothetical protein
MSKQKVCKSFKPQWWVDADDSFVTKICYNDLELTCSLHPAYRVFLQNDATTLISDHWPWKAIGFLFLSWWLNVSSCMILKLMIWSLSCLLGFLTKWCNDLDLWPWKAISLFPLMWSSVSSYLTMRLMVAYKVRTDRWIDGRHHNKIHLIFDGCMKC